MKAMILAAGRGERMRPLTDTLPKPLLQAGGKPLITRHIEALARAGVSEIVINTGWQGDKLPAALGDGARFGVQIHYSVEGWPALETAGGILNALPLLGEAPFILVNGDVYCDFEFAGLQLQAEDLGQLLVVDNPSHHPQGDFALNNGRVQRDGANKLTYAGIAVLHPALFAGLTPGSRPLREILQQAIAAQRLGGHHHPGQWFDIGTPQRLAELDRLLSKH